MEFVLPASPDRPARTVRQTLYRDTVTLPAHAGAPAITVTAILAREEQPPTGEKPIAWRLLTNRCAETLKAVVELIDWYRSRWLIEIFFRILKSGCQVEALQLGTLERLERALVIYLIHCLAHPAPGHLGARVPQLTLRGRLCSRRMASRLDRGTPYCTPRGTPASRCHGAGGGQLRGILRA